MWDSMDILLKGSIGNPRTTSTVAREQRTKYNSPHRVWRGLYDVVFVFFLVLSCCKSFSLLVLYVSIYRY